MLPLYEVKGGVCYYCMKLREGGLLLYEVKGGGWLLLYEVKGGGCYYCMKLREGDVTIVRS